MFLRPRFVDLHKTGARFYLEVVVARRENHKIWGGKKR